MRSFALSFAATILAFICGIVTASSWNSNHRRAQYLEPTDIERCPQTKNNPAPVAVATPAPYREVIIGEGLRLVTDEVKLKSENLRYDITLNYPQVVGTNDARFQKLNQHLKQLAEDQYQGMLVPSKADLQYYQKAWPGVFNSVTMDYDISLANDSMVSIYLDSYTYGIGAAHSVQQSYGVNYDLTSGKILKLSDVFKRGSNYLEFISRYCKEKLSEKYGETIMSNPALAPRRENFESWNLTRKGITLHFDACSVLACSEGEQTIQIPFSAMADLLTLDNL